MSGHRTPRLNRRAAGALLDGHPDDAGHDRLAALFAAVKVDPLATTTLGELTARGAYRARTELGPAPRSWLPARTAAVRACAVTAAGMVVAVTGLAFTAGAGDLPTPLQNAVHHAFGGPPPHGHPRLPGPTPSDRGQPTSSSSRQQPAATPSPSADLTALCRTYQASVVPTPAVGETSYRRSHHHHWGGDGSYQQESAPAIASPAPTASAAPEWLVTLAAAAGGRQQVAVFCRQQLGQQTPGLEAAAPTGTTGLDSSQRTDGSWSSGRH